jgi:hypothetical protein
VATGTSDELASSGISVRVADNSQTTLYANDTVAGISSACTREPLTYVERSPAARRFNLKAAVRRCKKHHRAGKRKRCIRQAKKKARRLELPAGAG